MNTEFKLSIVIQVFIKNHLLDDVITALLSVKNIDSCNIIFWQDSLIGSKYYNNDYEINHKKTKEIINNYITKFKHAEFKSNISNLGTCATCKTAMDYAFTKSQYAILIEDDLIVSKNFLNFFTFFIDNNYLNIDKNIVTIGGESIFFNAKNKSINDENIDIANKLIDKYTLNQYYTFVENFVPSTCFCTSKSIWQIIGSIRGLPTGCNKLNDYVTENKLKTITPVVPVCKDIGMLDQNGYSMKIHGHKLKNNPTHPWEYKNVYLLDNSNNTDFSLFNLNTNKLYDISVNLNINCNLELDI
jgi:hypothetical protein